MGLLRALQAVLYALLDAISWIDSTGELLYAAISNPLED